MRTTAGRGQSQGRASGRMNDAFVVAEIALTLMLLVGSGLMLKSLWQLTRVDPGFDATHVLTMNLTLPPERYDSLEARNALLRQLEERLAAVPGVAMVGAIDILPLSGASSGIPYRVEGQSAPDGNAQVVNLRTVTPDYFRALRIPLQRGRLLGPEDVPVDSGGWGAVLVNQAFARQHWPEGDPLGGRILTAQGEPVGRVVGVVQDARQASVDAVAAPEVYAAASQWGWPGGYLLVRGARDVPGRTAVLAALRAVEPDLGVRNVRAMDEVVRAAMDDARFYTRLLTGFAVLALVLGLIGVYGVMTYAASRRTREFGVRLALGATRRDLLLHVMARAMTPVGIGVVVGVGGALALARLLSSFLFDVAPGDPAVLGAVAVLLALAAAGAALAASRHATRDSVSSQRRPVRVIPGASVGKCSAM
jgi:predicted permease